MNSIRVLLPFVFFFLLNSAQAQHTFWHESNLTYGSAITGFARDYAGTLYAGSRGDGVLRSTDSGYHWSTMNSGLGSTTVFGVASANGGTILAGTGGDPSRTWMYRSTDQGNNWSLSDSGLPADYVVRMASNDSGHVFAALAAHGAYRSTDNGSSWVECNAGITDTSLSFVATDTLGIVIAATRSGKLFRSTNEGTSWSLFWSDPHSRIPSAIALDKEHRVYVSVSDSLYRISEGGQAWVTLQRPPLSSSITSVAINGYGHIYVALSSQGILRSTDEGQSWEILNDGLNSTYETNVWIDGDGHAFVGSNYGTIARSERTTLSPLTRVFLDFGGIGRGSSKTVDVRLTNWMNIPLDITSAVSDNPSFSVSAAPLVLQPYDSVVFPVTFQPSSYAAFTGSIAISSSSPSSPDTLFVAGWSYGNAAAVLSTTNIKFDSTKVGSHRDTVIVITNSGGDTLFSSSVTKPASITLSPSAWIIPPGATLYDTLRFTPKAPGRWTGSVIVSYNGTISPAIIRFSGTVVDNKLLLLNPTSIDFGYVRMGDSATATFTLKNAGEDSIQLSTIFPTSDFRIGALPSSFPVGDSVVVPAVFKPKSYGLRQIVFGIPNNTANLNINIHLRGICADSARYALPGKSILFPPVPIGSVRDSIILVQNEGSDTLRLLNYASTSSDISYIPSSTKIPPWSSVRDTVRLFGNAQGSKWGNVYLYNNSRVSPETLYVEGYVHGQPKLEGLPTSISFDTVYCLEAKNAVITYSNPGTDTLVIKSVVSSNGLFFVRNARLTVSAGKTVTDTITFRPASIGLQTATLTITSNAHAYADTIYVRGTGKPNEWISLSSTFSYILSLTVDTHGVITALESSGNLFRSADSGGHWSPLTITPTSSVYAFCLIQTPHGTLFTGTDQGIFKSSDRGATWSMSIAGIGIGRVQTLYASDAGNIYASKVDTGANGGLYRSTNSGDSWTHLYDQPIYGPVFSVAEAHASTIYLSSPMIGVERSDDSGVLWAHVFPDSADIYVNYIATHPEGTIFTGTSNVGLFKSDDDGTTWIAVGQGFAGQGIQSLAAGPNGTVIVGAGNSLYRSTDKGNTWAEYRGGLQHQNVSAISFGSDGYLYVGTTVGSIFKTVLPEFTVGVPNFDGSILPTEYVLHQNYPNPFNPSTMISFDLPEATDVKLTIHDLIGRTIETLVDKHMQRGRYRFEWRATAYSTGVYFLRIESQTFKATKKLIYIK